MLMDCTEELAVEADVDVCLSVAASQPDGFFGNFAPLCRSASPDDAAAGPCEQSSLGLLQFHCSAPVALCASACAPAAAPAAAPAGAAACALGGSPPSATAAVPLPSYDLNGSRLLVSQLATMHAQEATGRTAVLPTYLTTLHDGCLQAGWRHQVVEWLFDVGAEFNLSRTCTFAAVQLLDRFLSVQAVRHGELQMLALACCVVASKVHDTTPIRMGDIDVWFADIASAVDIAKVELVLLSTLKWDLHATTALDFGSRFCGLIADAALADAVMAEVHKLVFVAACDYSMLRCTPSEVGLCAFVLACRVCGQGGGLDGFLSSVAERLPSLKPPRAADLEALAELYSARFARCHTPAAVSVAASCLA